METGLTITSEERDGRTIVALDGEVDATNSQRLRAALSALVTDDHTRIILDLTALTFVDSSGLAVFIYLHKLTGRHGGWVRLSGADGTVHRLLSLTGLTRTVPIYPTVADALNA